jgi:hypothetical protein
MSIVGMIAFIAVQLFCSIFIYYNHKPGLQWACVIPLVIMFVAVWIIIRVRKQGG